MLKKNVLTLMFFALSVSVVFAQKDKEKDEHPDEHRYPSERSEAYAADMQTTVGLSDLDRYKVKDLQLKRLEMLDEIKEKIRAKYPTKAERETEKLMIKDEFQPMKDKIQADFHAKLMKIISERQFEIWREHRDAETSGRKGRNEEPDYDDGSGE